MKKLYIETYGCQMNVADSEVVAAVMKMAGYEPTDNEAEADAVFLNTCSVRENAENKIYHRLDQLYAQQRHNSAEGVRRPILGVLGCMAERGCNNFCHYCIVPYTRGRERSRDVESILAEVRDLHDRGFKEVTLLGQNVNSYGLLPNGKRPDNGIIIEEQGGQELHVCSFAELLRRVAEAVPDMRVRFTTSNPEDMSEDILHAIADEPNLCHHIHFPVQSGSDKVLHDMNRKYTREDYLRKVDAIRRIIPDCGLTTDVFVGYHDETEDDFQQTLSLMKTVGFDAAFMFKYSERPGTYAAKHLPDNVPEEEKIRRLNTLIHLQTEISAERNRQDKGKEFEILIERFSKRSHDQLMGRTPQNKAVVVARGNHHIGDRVRVRITGSSSATLFGEEIVETLK